MSIIAFDLDGTLAPVGKPMSPQVTDRLHRLEDRGERIVICSGKPCYYLCGMLRQVGLRAPVLIGENGAAIQLGVELPPLVRGKVPCPDGAEEKLADIQRSLAERFAGQVWFQPNEHMVTCFPHSEELFDPIADVIAGHEPEQSGLTVYRHGDCFDIIPNTIDKGAGLRELCRMVGDIPERCIAVGDHVNDLPMFRAAGLGISVGTFRPSEAQLHFDCIEEALDYLLERKTEE